MANPRETLMYHELGSRTGYIVGSLACIVLDAHTQTHNCMLVLYAECLAIHGYYLVGAAVVDWTGCDLQAVSVIHLVAHGCVVEVSVV